MFWVFTILTVELVYNIGNSCMVNPVNLVSASVTATWIFLSEKFPSLDYYQQVICNYSMFYVVCENSALLHFFTDEMVCTNN